MSLVILYKWSINLYCQDALKLDPFLKKKCEEKRKDGEEYLAKNLQKFVLFITSIDKKHTKQESTQLNRLQTNNNIQLSEISFCGSKSRVFNRTSQTELRRTNI